MFYNIIYINLLIILSHINSNYYNKNLEKNINKTIIHHYFNLTVIKAKL